MAAAWFGNSAQRLVPLNLRRIWSSRVRRCVGTRFTRTSPARHLAPGFSFPDKQDRRRPLLPPRANENSVSAAARLSSALIRPRLARAESVTQALSKGLPVERLGVNFDGAVELCNLEI